MNSSWKKTIGAGLIVAMTATVTPQAFAAEGTPSTSTSTEGSSGGTPTDKDSAGKDNASGNSTDGKNGSESKPDKETDKETDKENDKKTGGDTAGSVADKVTGNPTFSKIINDLGLDPENVKSAIGKMGLGSVKPILQAFGIKGGLLSLLPKADPALNALGLSMKDITSGNIDPTKIKFENIGQALGILGVDTNTIKEKLSPENITNLLNTLGVKTDNLNTEKLGELLAKAKSFLDNTTTPGGTTNPGDGTTPGNTTTPGSDITGTTPGDATTPGADNGATTNPVNNESSDSVTPGDNASTGKDGNTDKNSGNTSSTGKTEGSAKDDSTPDSDTGDTSKDGSTTGKDKQDVSKKDGDNGIAGKDDSASGRTSTSESTRASAPSLHVNADFSGQRTVAPAPVATQDAGYVSYSGTQVGPKVKTGGQADTFVSRVAQIFL